MTGVNAAPITAVSVVDKIKYVWYVAVDVIASDSSLRSFGGTFSKSDQKCHQILREQTILRIRAHLYIEPAAMTGRST